MQRVAIHPNPLTVASADFLLLLTAVPAQEMSADNATATYRLRWQIELAFLRPKSGLGIDALRRVTANFYQCAMIRTHAPIDGGRGT